MLKFRNQRKAESDPALRLYEVAVARSRQPTLYATMGAPDTVEGRFELLTAHVLLIIDRLNQEGDRGRVIGQSLFDLYLRNLDGALREMGVGDLAVGKRMKSLGQIFYGRALAYEKAFRSTDAADLPALIGRTILVTRPEADPRRLRDYLLGERERLSKIEFDVLGLEPAA